jgi:hypothetical protein
MGSFPITTLTPAAAQQRLQNDGLGTLGLTAVRLSTRWADTTPAAGDYNAGALTLNLPGNIHAPFLGILTFAFQPARSTLASPIGETDTTIALAAGAGAGFPSPTGGGAVMLVLSDASGAKREVVACTARADDSLTVVRGMDGTAAQTFSAGDRVTLRLPAGARSAEFTGADGAPLSGSCAVLRLHPQAVLRLERLAEDRYAQPGNPPIRPVPWAMVVRGAQGFTTSRWYEPDEIMTGISGPVSFHDGRGLIIDPIYVAAMFSDLQTALPGLLPATVSGPANGPGGVTQIAAIGGAGTLIHVVDPHGNVYRPATGGATLVTIDAGDNVTGSAPASGLFTLNPGDRIRAVATDGGLLRWGWATFGTLGRAPLAPPPLPAGPTLPKQFFRVMAVDAEWSLLGNRTAGAVLGVGPDDQRIPSDLLPRVRDQVRIDYLADGPDTLGEIETVLNRPSQSMILAVSPQVDQTLAMPAQRGPNAHWPAFPAPNTNAGFPGPPSLPAGSVTAVFTAANDVVVTIAGGLAPDGAHVRIYPRQFVEIAAIAEEPSFLRADGGAAIAAGTNPVAVLLPNPFRLAPGQPRPSPAVLTMDIVIAPRLGNRRLFGNISASVGSGPAAPPADPFSAAPGTTVLGAMLPQMLGVSSSPLFNIPRPAPPPPGPPPSNILDLVLSLAAEPSPREAPRLPTMARLETVAVTGTTGPGAPQPPGSLFWDAVLSGGRLARESRSALHERANPGNPAGPDVHAPGVRATGALGYDLALHALRRVQPIIPLPSTAGTNSGWVAASLGDNFNAPDDSAGVDTGIGVLLETVAVGCETPWLGSLTPPPPGLTVQQLINNAASQMGLPPPAIAVSIQNEPRVQREIRREFFVARQGLRDAQWSLRRALAEARELVYIESPQFARTARPAGAPQPFEVDLVAEFAARLSQHPELKVLICTARDPDFAVNFKGWWRQHYQARVEAMGDLLAAAPDRVALFHPVGFPGRTAFIRTTSVIVDDVWCLVGATHFRRRGLSFDGSAAIASFDRQLEHGYSRRVREYRRALMAAKLKVQPPAPGVAPSGDWLRLARPASAFDLVADLLAQGGLGRIQPLYPGPADTTVLPAGANIADPDGSDGANFVTTFAGMLNEAGD